MSHKNELRLQRDSTVINDISTKQEKDLRQAVEGVIKNLKQRFPEIRIEWETDIKLVKVIEDLKQNFPNISFGTPLKTSSMKPDGGILYIKSTKGTRFPILISEKKNQGTNDLRALEGKKKQAKGNAIERLGKNVIGLRTALLNENIFPFVCFGDGCDFEEESSILDRVMTIAMFGELNVEHLHNIPPFNRGTFYFRPKPWTENEMMQLSTRIAVSSIYYYFSKYGEDTFKFNDIKRNNI